MYFNLWNNKEIRVDNKPVSYNKIKIKIKLFEQDFISVNDLLLELDTTILLLLFRIKLAI